MIEALLKLLKSKYVKLGFYIELDKPCIMVQDKEGNVLDWIDIDFDVYNLLEELLKENE